MKIRTALIGFGLGGRAFHAPYVASRDEFDFVAVVSREHGKVHSVFSQVRVVDSVEAVLELENIDLVIVSSPDHHHFEHAMAAIAAGKHVVIDKPIAPSLREAHVIRDAARSSGRVVAAFQNRRWDADFLTLQDLIQSGQLGDIVHFESHFDRWRPLDPDSWKEARQGGSWQDLGPHLIDQAIVLFGMPEAVTADIACLRKDAPAPDWFHVILHYGTMRATLHSSKIAADHRLRFAVHGTGGSWLKHGLDMQELQALQGCIPGTPGYGNDPNGGVITLASNVTEHLPFPNRCGNYGLFWVALAEAIRGVGANPVPLDQAMLTMEVMDAAQASSANARTVYLSDLQGRNGHDKT